ncbi:hypothetical protein [Oceanospirillum linum]|uniref:Uncharacterized protein n=1 Tax=Oceanospirillum linum TaxID=966 RepID=A0A1T1H8J1_OCELI|nr:hypothetical protein [Oceanospirillum linum]OOV86152.1 hypothetical protein BTA35_0214310 [Oceanospirillum linum]SEG39233.1 hypothetical protein SAMN04489856_109121 [Oleiphilus messinensis]SMP31615.1 hypothetical protein SAMN06264348_1098 [Oceanospirillum linum]
MWHPFRRSLPQDVPVFPVLADGEAQPWHLQLTPDLIPMLSSRPDVVLILNRAIHTSDTVACRFQHTPALLFNWCSHCLPADAGWAQLIEWLERPADHLLMDLGLEPTEPVVSLMPHMALTVWPLAVLRRTLRKLGTLDEWAWVPHCQNLTSAGLETLLIDPVVRSSKIAPLVGSEAEESLNQNKDMLYELAILLGDRSLTDQACLTADIQQFDDLARLRGQLIVGENHAVLNIRRHFQKRYGERLKAHFGKPPVEGQLGIQPLTSLKSILDCHALISSEVSLETLRKVNDGDYYLYQVEYGIELALLTLERNPTVWLGLPDSDDLDCGNGDRLHIYSVDHATEVALKPESERDDHWVAVSLFAGKGASISSEFKCRADGWLKDAGVTSLMIS